MVESMSDAAVPADPFVARAGVSRATIAAGGVAARGGVAATGKVGGAGGVSALAGDVAIGVAGGNAGSGTGGTGRPLGIGVSRPVNSTPESSADPEPTAIVRS